MSIETSLMGYPSRVLPQPKTDNAGLYDVRMDRYGGINVLSSPPSAHGYADEGTYMVATNPTIGTGLTWVLAQTAFSDTAPNFYFYNAESPSDPAAKTIFLHYLKMIATVAATAATAIHYAFVLDNVARAIGTDNTASIVPVCTGSVRGTPLAFGGSGNSIVKAQNSTTASVIAASSANKRIVARGVLGGLNIVGDEMQINFGSIDGGAQAATTAVEGAGQPGRRVSCSPPVGVPPGFSLTGHIWMPASSASFNPEFELGMWAR